MIKVRLLLSSYIGDLLQTSWPTDVITFTGGRIGVAEYSAHEAFVEFTSYIRNEEILNRNSALGPKCAVDAATEVWAQRTFVIPESTDRILIADVHYILITP